MHLSSLVTLIQQAVTWFTSILVTMIPQAVTWLISILGIGWAVITFRINMHAASRPILVFSLNKDNLWIVRNVGKGPAVTILIGDKWMNRNDWPMIMYCNTLPAGESMELTWIHEGFEILAIYTDVFALSHATYCVNGKNAFVKRRHFPKRLRRWTEWEFRLLKDELLLLHKEETLQGKTAFELDILRNEYYAKHGYIFARKDLSEYFSKQNWYIPLTRDQAQVNCRLSKEERATALYILYYQIRNGLLTKQPTSQSIVRRLLAWIRSRFTSSSQSTGH
jgi:hypothetical protein